MTGTPDAVQECPCLIGGAGVQSCTSDDGLFDTCQCPDINDLDAAAPSSTPTPKKPATMTASRVFISARTKTRWSVSPKVTCTNATDTDTDPNNCGSCGNQCSLSEFCATGSCQAYNLCGKASFPATPVSPAAIVVYVLVRGRKP